MFFFVTTGNRLSNFVVGVTDVKPYQTAPSPDSLVLCTSYPGTGRNGQVFDLYCGKPVRGLFLVVQLKNTNPLTLCEVQSLGR